MSGDPVEINPSMGSGYKVRLPPPPRGDDVEGGTLRFSRRTERNGRAADSPDSRAHAGGPPTKIMTVNEWSARWKQNGDFPECLKCGSENTKEHHFIQTWCRGKKKWESETLCLDCFSYSWRSYSDPDFLLPEDYEKLKWEKICEEGAQVQEITA